MNANIRSSSLLISMHLRYLWANIWLTRDVFLASRSYTYVRKLSFHILYAYLSARGI